MSDVHEILLSTTKQQLKDMYRQLKLINPNHSHVSACACDLCTCRGLEPLLDEVMCNLQEFLLITTKH
jgi:hypothetical protein